MDSELTLLSGRTFVEIPSPIKLTSSETTIYGQPSHPILPPHLNYTKSSETLSCINQPSDSNNACWWRITMAVEVQD